ncbi:EF-hand domain-containing protein [Pseudoalteromonas sp. MMG010]|uniref:EF-hand domain-containing protein n=1 Tax=Pseudoalteromonas sp. MMG010 TaxID=2822685 RepID=UPI001B3A4311|nr:EF-hand domain-containing protein [Pseudoalteromonas sp. MMG010]MBQ4833123.1 EF-hand domain-containing protein [Pseudoalteromonas sp. MMG010]
MKRSTPITLITLALLAFTANAGAQDRSGPPQKPDFSSIDSDGSGSISYDEFNAKKPPHIDDVQSIFDEIDTDGNGEISEDEFSSHKPARRER